MMSFLEANGIFLNCSDGDLVKLGLGLADCSLDEGDVLDFIIEHS